MKAAAVKVDTYIGYCIVHNKQDSKFRFVDHMRISKYKNIFAKEYIPNWSEEVIKKVKNAVQWTYIIIDLKNEEIVGTFYEKELQKSSQKNSGLKKKSRKKVIDCMSNGRVMIIH